MLTQIGWVCQDLGRFALKVDYQVVSLYAQYRALVMVPALYV